MRDSAVEYVLSVVMAALLIRTLIIAWRIGNMEIIIDKDTMSIMYTTILGIEKVLFVGLCPTTPVPTSAQKKSNLEAKKWYG